jgi:flagellar hook-associated protein 3 FlgL
MERVTNVVLSNTVLANNQRTLARMADYQEQLASGKRINRVSDDPVAAKIAMRYRAEDQQAAKHLDNVGKAIAFQNATDSALGEMATTMDEVKSLAVQGANGTQDAASRRALAEAVDSQLARLVDIANTVHDGRYIFSGTAVLTKPFTLSEDRTAVTYQGDLDTFEVAVSQAATATVNENGFALFQGEVDIFRTLIDLRDALAENDPAGVADLMGTIDTAANHINDLHGAMGGRLQRLELTRNQLENSRLYVGELISDAEDADLPDVIAKMQLTQTALEAGLQSGARVIQQTLLDFLR